MPEKGAVSRRCGRIWGAGGIWVVQGYPFFFQVEAVLLLLAMSWGPLVLLPEP